MPHFAGSRRAPLAHPSGLRAETWRAGAGLQRTQHGSAKITKYFFVIPCCREFLPCSELRSLSALKKSKYRLNDSRGGSQKRSIAQVARGLTNMHDALSSSSVDHGRPQHSAHSIPRRVHYGTTLTVSALGRRRSCTRPASARLMRMTAQPTARKMGSTTSQPPDAATILRRSGGHSVCRSCTAGDAGAHGVCVWGVEGGWDGCGRGARTSRGARRCARGRSARAGS